MSSLVLRLLGKPMAFANKSWKQEEILQEIVMFLLNTWLLKSSFWCCNFIFKYHHLWLFLISKILLWQHWTELLNAFSYQTSHNSTGHLYPDYGCDGTCSNSHLTRAVNFGTVKILRWGRRRERNGHCRWDNLVGVN